VLVRVVVMVYRLSIQTAAIETGSSSISVWFSAASRVVNALPERSTGEQISHQFARHRQRGTVGVAAGTLALVHLFPLRIPQRRDLCDFNQNRLQINGAVESRLTVDPVECCAAGG